VIQKVKVKVKMNKSIYILVDPHWELE